MHLTDLRADFSLRRAVCSHGWFVLAPNRWDPSAETFHTVISLSEHRAVAVSVTQRDDRLHVRTPAGLGAAATRRITSSLSRMLRLDEDLSDFHVRCRASATHEAAAECLFGRLLRAGDLFEDIVKVICTCNVTWRQTVSMVENLVQRWGVPVRPARGAGKTPAGEDHAPRAFPTPDRLAAASVDELRSVARLGYRAAYVSALARDVSEGRLDLNAFERFEGSTDALRRSLKGIHGVGDYAAGNLCMLLGRYDSLAVDTEMVRFLRDRYPRRRFTPASMRKHYEAWRPYQFLAYWWELWQGYEERHGPASQWLLDGAGRRITAPGDGSAPAP